MNHEIDGHDHAKAFLHSEPCSQAHSAQNSVLRRLQQGWFKRFSRSCEPEIWQTIDENGYIWWHGYHPQSNSHATRESEMAILAWLEHL